jgi:Concanavalin A-like lectin/glucanases superfamily
MSLLNSVYRIAAAANGRRDFAYADLVMDTGPVAWWPLDTNLVERIGGRNGVIGAGSAVHAGALPEDSGGSFNCAGTNWVSVAHASVLKPAVGSLMVWFKPASLQDEARIVAADLGGTNVGDFALHLLSAGRIAAYFQSTTDVITTSVAYYVSGQTVHAIVTWGASGFSLYLDGNLIGRFTDYTDGLTGNTQDWVFGFRQLNGQIFNGAIDEIAIWNRVLTRNEIYLLAQTEPTE